MISSDDALRKSIINSTHPPQQDACLVDAAGLAVGGLLTCVALSQVGRVGWMPVGLGMALLYDGLKWLTNDVASPQVHAREMAEDRVAQQVANSPEDEASWESFPASDPPTFTGQIT